MLAQHEYRRLPLILAFAILVLLATAGVAQDNVSSSHAVPAADSPKTWRSALEDKGLEASCQFTADVMANVRGGIRTGVVPLGLLKLILDLDFEKLTKQAFLADAKFHASAYYPYGADISGQYVGDISGVDNISAYNSFRLYELWLEKGFHLGPINGSLRVGQMGADFEFAINTTASIFLNGTYGAAVAFTGNLPYPGYPFTALGARLELSTGHAEKLKTTFRSAVFDGHSSPSSLASLAPAAPFRRSYNPHGVIFHLNPARGLLFLAELSFDYLNEEPNTDGGQAGEDLLKGPPSFYIGPGHILLGGFYHSGLFRDAYLDRLHDLGVPGYDADVHHNRGDYGGYVLWEQRIFHDSPKSPYGLSTFVRSIFMPADRNFVTLSAEVGAVYNGIFVRKQSNDLFGFGLAVNRIGDRIRAADRVATENGIPVSNPNAEFAFEWIYSFPLRSNWRLQPDIQFIYQPGSSTEYQNAVVLGLRTIIDF